ncbi:unnamed protein product [Linum tenue]|uniref:Alcohol dehydrogenase-like C-terminal domain-containing protein n=1 Tax=Linum tenue TaxID=586396 RepID=A0AAV0KBM2_9ROSI|nr:unnamed protein product [Linum tenue]
MAKKSPDEVHPVKAFGWAASDPSGHLSPFSFSRRATGEEDVRFKVLYCGICHSDLHCIKNEWGFSTYPLLPGYICFTTYTPTRKSISHFTVARERYIVRFPENMPLDAGAPLLCAGITVYSPMKYYGLSEPGMHIAVVGLGGLGHVAVKFAKAFGARVTVVSTSPKKEEEALKRLGADSFLVSTNMDQLKKEQFTLDGIIDTVSAVHPLLPLLGLLKANGKLILVGAPEKPLELPAFSVIMGRKTVAGSNIGGMKETQEMIDFAAKHNITADIEIIKADYLNTAMERLAKGDVRYRFVIDIANSVADIYRETTQRK